jgi:regulator of replication initiation timing
MNENTLIATIDELKNKLKSLAEENATLRYERDLARAQAFALLPTATEEEEKEFIRLKQTAVPNGLANLIAELEETIGK